MCQVGNCEHLLQKGGFAGLMIGRSPTRSIISIWHCRKSPPPPIRELALRRSPYTGMHGHELYIGHVTLYDVTGIAHVCLVD